MLKGFQNEAKMDAGAALGSQLLDFGSQNLQNITKTAPQINEKSRLRFWSVFGAAFGRQGGGRLHYLWAPFGDHFGPKLEKRHPKRHAKFDVEKVSKIHAKTFKISSKLLPKSMLNP